ncbi:MAG: succinate dehydrogenase, cytochrome b556 subunit [Dehalococcoidia bacterium]
MLHSPSTLRRKWVQQRIGWWAWLGLRISGVALVFYLLAHIAVISTALRGPDTFDRLLKVLQSPPFVVADLLLLLAVLYHGVMGLRVMLLEAGIPLRWQERLAWVGIALILVGMAGATWAVWPLILR